LNVQRASPKKIAITPHTATSGNYERKQKTKPKIKDAKHMSEEKELEEIQCAAQAIKNLRLESKVEWNGSKEIRKWRDAAT